MYQISGGGITVWLERFVSGEPLEVRDISVSKSDETTTDYHLAFRRSDHCTPFDFWGEIISFSRGRNVVVHEARFTVGREEPLSQIFSTRSPRIKAEGRLKQPKNCGQHADNSPQSDSDSEVEEMPVVHSKRIRKPPSRYAAGSGTYTSRRGRWERPHKVARIQPKVEEPEFIVIDSSSSDSEPTRGEDKGDDAFDNSDHEASSAAESSDNQVIVIRRRTPPTIIHERKVTNSDVNRGSVEGSPPADNSVDRSVEDDDAAALRPRLPLPRRAVISAPNNATGPHAQDTSILFPTSTSISPPLPPSSGWVPKYVPLPPTPASTDPTASRNSLAITQYTASSSVSPLANFAPFSSSCHAHSAAFATPTQGLTTSISATPLKTTVSNWASSSTKNPGTPLPVPVSVARPSSAPAPSPAALLAGPSVSRRKSLADGVTLPTGTDGQQSTPFSWPSASAMKASSLSSDKAAPACPTIVPSARPHQPFGTPGKAVPRQPLPEEAEQLRYWMKQLEEEHRIGLELDMDPRMQIVRLKEAVDAEKTRNAVKRKLIDNLESC
ncbi:hypothetical protein FISHEDRAFT_56408 [Fistulina hepatica ATCC 64428]|uniref:Uncharacterized protein n=1 Tax=Fistulina hepatica ATCC 64428 TaxID=1128425 RepID=A0A0D7AIZ5_9AGAR|nr:hypothetical protein FISHEDRAFT_56408 [Fistulina hepatica ATCC 64428]